MSKILVFGLAIMLLFSSTSIFIPNAYAKDFTISTDCQEEFFVLTVTGKGEPLQNVSTYTLTTKRDVIEKYVSDENGEVKIPKSSMTGMLKIIKGGYNDSVIASDCYVEWKPPRAQGDREVWHNYSQGSGYNDFAKDIADFCDSNHEMYKLLGALEWQKMTSQTSSAFVRHCLILFQSSVYPYAGEDRKDVFMNYLDEYYAKQVQQDEQERIKNTQQAMIDADTSVKSSLAVDELKQRIEFLESQLEEKDKQLANKDLILMEQLKVIQQLASSFKKTIFEPISQFFGFA